VASEHSLKKYLRNYLSDWPEDKTTRFIAAFVDLKGDGKQEAIVYLSGQGWCGSGGCVTLILAPEGSSYRLVTKTTTTRPPIRVLARASNGWSNIAVWVQGGGIQPGYEAELRFDGKTYPTSPSVPPAQPSGNAAGIVVVSPSQDGKALYP
jgi:hypothetical protein